MNYKRISMVIGIILIATAIAIGISLRTQSSSSKKVSVATSFYPLGFFAQQVGGEAVTVSILTPTGTEPHDFEPTARDIADLQKARLFIFNGSGLDTWADRIETDLVGQGVTTLRMSDAVALRPADAPEEEADHDDEVDHEAVTDPHFWLDPVIAQREVQLIADNLSAINPAHTDLYRANAENTINRLKQLDQSYQQGLANCQSKEIITSHAAFGYLAARYGLTVHAIAGLNPDQEPSAQQLADLTALAREKQVKAIFFETLTSPRLAETLATELHVQTLVFNPLEGLTSEEQSAGDTYFSVMEQNLQQLRLALQCS